MYLRNADHRNDEADCACACQTYKLSWKIDILFFNQEYLDSIQMNV